MTIAVYSPNGSISLKDSSHRAAWPKMMLDNHGIKDFVLQPEPADLAKFDEVWLYMGMEFDNNLNLFGGASAENAERLLAITQAKHLSYLQTKPGRFDIPNLGTIAKGRCGKKGVSLGWESTDWDNLNRFMQNATVVYQTEKPNSVIGDSHALSLYDGTGIIFRYDHKTLHGALKEGLGELFGSYDYLFPTVTFCFGNIDLQHHLVRLGKSATIELVEKYVDQVLRTIRAERIELVELLPVFPETRKISMPGYYKGKPWGGSWAERNELRKVFNDELTKLCKPHGNLHVVRWPEYITNAAGEFDPAYMEKPKGVHLSWEHRRQTWPT